MDNTNGNFSSDDNTRSAPVRAIMPVGRNATHYNMNHENRGMALIFNHKTFQVPGKHLEMRYGTDYDVRSVLNILNKLDFSVTVYDDLEYATLCEVVANAATFDHTNYDCFIMVVLSHGTENNILYCYDRGYNFDDLWTPFSANQCTSLAGKPKIFFVQACRGYNYMAPVSLNVTETDGPFNISTSYKIPSKADFLFYFATIPGYNSWRNPDDGSWFIQALCKELEKSAYKHEIFTILTLVNQRVAINFESNVPGDPKSHQRKQIPTIESRLTRLLQFNRKGENLDNAVEDGEGSLSSFPASNSILIESRNEQSYHTTNIATVEHGNTETTDNDKVIDQIFWELFEYRRPNTDLF